MAAVLRVALVVVLGLTRVGAVGGDEPAKVEPGTPEWEKGFPQAVAAPAGQPAGAVRILGKLTPKPGSTVTTLEVRCFPAGGGEVVTAKLDHADGVWGEKRDGKIVPRAVALPKGNWQVWVYATYTPAGGGRPVEFGSRFVPVEVK